MPRYSDDLRATALKLSDEIGNIEAAKQLNLNKKTIEYWRMIRKREENKKQAKKLEKVIKPVEVDPAKELKNNSKISFQAAEKETREFKRGEIYYVSRDITFGAEIATGRPAVIVSNDVVNQKLHTIEVVFLTTKIKPISPCYTTLRATGLTSTSVCDQISTIDKSRIREYIGRCTPEEMEKIEKAMLYSLGLENYKPELMSDEQILFRMHSIKSERDVYRDLYNELLEKMTQK